MWTNSLRLLDLYHRWKYVGWIISFYTAGTAAWPCGYDDGNCPGGDIYVPNPNNCRQYYRCVHYRWTLNNCTVANNGNRCGMPVRFCKTISCPEQSTASPKTTNDGMPRRRSSTIISETTVRSTIETRDYSTVSSARYISSTTGQSTSSSSSSDEPTTSKETATKTNATTMKMLAEVGDSLSNTGGSSDGGVVAGSIIAVILVLVILTLGLIWWKRRDLLLRVFRKGDPMNSAAQCDTPYVYKNPDDIKAGKEHPKNNNDRHRQSQTSHIYSEPTKKLSQVSHGGDMSPVFMRSNSFYGGEQPFYNSADDTKYDVVDSHEYTYTRPTDYEANAKEVHYDTTPSEADDVYYSTVAKDIDGANKQNWKDVRQPPRSGTPPYADIIPKNKRASDPNVADDIDDYSLARDPGLANLQEPLYFELENPADAPHYQNTNKA